MRSSELKKLKKGTRLVMTKKSLEFYWNEAWTMCTFAGKLTSDKDAEDYVMYKLMGVGAYESIKFLHYISDVGDDEPGAAVMVTFPKGLRDRKILRASSLRRAK